MTTVPASATMTQQSIFDFINRNKDDRDNQQSTSSSTGSVKAILMACQGAAIATLEAVLVEFSCLFAVSVTAHCMSATVTSQCTVSYTAALLKLFDCCFFVSFHISCKFAAATVFSAWCAVLLQSLSPHAAALPLFCCYWLIVSFLMYFSSIAAAAVLPTDVATAAVGMAKLFLLLLLASSLLV